MRFEMHEAGEIALSGLICFWKDALPTLLPDGPSISMAQ